MKLEDFQCFTCEFWDETDDCRKGWGVCRCDMAPWANTKTFDGAGCIYHPNFDEAFCRQDLGLLEAK